MWSSPVMITSTTARAKEIDGGNYSFYYMYHGTRFESTDPLSMAHCDDHWSSRRRSPVNTP